MAVVSETTIVGEALLAARAVPPAGRVLIALSDGPLVAEPAWTPYDGLDTCRCSGFDWQRGRQSEFDITETSTARVYFHDLAGVLNTEDLIGKQIALQLYNPVDTTWHLVFRGHIDDVSEILEPGVQELANVQIDCVDLFDYLAGVRMVVGEFGNPYPTDKMQGVVFYEDGNADVRAEALLTDAQLDPDLYVVFSLNVDVNESVYGPDDNVLQALRDTVDADFPSLANVFTDRSGRVVIHGRRARFFPDDVADDAGTDAWPFHRWEAATWEDVGTTRAQIREFSYNRPRTRIVNSYVAWPREDENGKPFKQALIQTLTRTDPTSIAAYGYRGREASDLIIKRLKPGIGSSTGAEQCGLFGDFWMANYTVPRKNIQNVTFRSVWPDDPRAAATWDLMTQIDIADILELWVDEAALTDAEFYVEGIVGQCLLLNPEYDDVTVTPNLSPASYYATDPFE